MMNPCRCGTKRDLAADTDEMTQATWIECLGCHRLVGGLNPQEAAAMWNAAIMACVDVTPAKAGVQVN